MLSFLLLFIFSHKHITFLLVNFMNFPFTVYYCIHKKKNLYFRQVIKTEAALLTTLEEMHTLSQKMFYNSLTCNCGKILEKIEMPPADLGPPEALKQTLTLLREVLSCQDACLVSIDDRQKDVPQVSNLKCCF